MRRGPLSFGATAVAYGDSTIAALAIHTMAPGQKAFTVAVEQRYATYSFEDDLADTVLRIRNARNAKLTLDLTHDLPGPHGCVQQQITVPAGQEGAILCEQLISAAEAGQASLTHHFKLADAAAVKPSSPWEGTSTWVLRRCGAPAGVTAEVQARGTGPTDLVNLQISANRRCDRVA